MLRHDVRCVRRIWCDEAQERLFRRLTRPSLDPRRRLAEPDLGAVAVVPFPGAVVAVGVVLIVVAPVVRRVAYAAAAVGDHLLEAAVLWAVRVGVSQVPLAEE